MALDLAGITNLDFYSPHYLDAVLESDLKAVFKKWKAAKDEKGTKQPQELLNSLSNAYFQALGQAEGERDPIRRWELAREFHVSLLEALGYPYKPEAALLEDNTSCPLVLSLERDGNPYLWVLDAPFVGDEDDDPLDATPYMEQLPSKNQDDLLPKNEKKHYASWRNILDVQIFHGDNAPRWVLFLAGSEVLLTERTKWPQGRYLRFELTEIFSRRQTATLKAMAGLLHKDSVSPDAGICLHDTLDENSHKHAYAVSTDLKYGVRRAVELLGNEAVWYRREVQKQAVFDEDSFPPDELTSECLAFLYRMLFLFYIEARGGELGIVPMDAEVYREGYSLETLRNLEVVPLTTEKARNGYYIHDSLRTLFRIINEGYPNNLSSAGELNLEDSYHDSMRISAMNSPLFDVDRLQIIKNVRFRNIVMQEVLQLLSLSSEKKRKSRGRISYSQLGINQLGAVYESILSYTGFFAHEDLYEVAAEKDCKSLSGKPPAQREALKTYFVPASKIGEYKDAEIVKDANERRIAHKKGAFIFRLAGRNREKSASYYTPEVLTHCLVKYALKELLWEDAEEGQKPQRKKTAEEILALTVCEPAMGSSAFLIEAVDQLADAYLDARQEEVKARGGETIHPEDYQREKRRVKARLATNNCYGVDLNPTAVELAKVSLWLATLHEEGKCPWFGLRLATGNSLVGARREVFKTADVTRKGTKDNPNWLSLVPEPAPLHHGDDAPPPDEIDWANWTVPPRPKGTIYHFLLPAEGMAAFDKDKVIKQLAPESAKRINEWRKKFCKPFNKKDADRLEQISDAVDRLFVQVVRERVLATQETSDRIPVWGEPQSLEEGAQQVDLLVRDQEAVAASLEDGSSALKLAMDAWCALWFWPIEEAGLLPDRATWLAQMELILKGQITHEEVWQQQGLFAELSLIPRSGPSTKKTHAAELAPQQEVGADRLKRLQELSEAFRLRRANYFDECGLADIETVLAGDASLRSAQASADRLCFHHWALSFAEVFARRGGFDLILGNPPWVRVSFDETGVLSDFDPNVAIRGLSATAVSLRRDRILDQGEAKSIFLDEMQDQLGAQSFLGDLQNFVHLVGIKSNLYKAFICQGWRYGGAHGLSAFLHPEGLFEDSQGGRFREQVYRRLTLHAQFANELKLFPEIGNRNKFSINSYRSSLQDGARFVNVSNLYHPSTLDACWSHDGHGPVPRIKSDDGNWELSGHKNRIIAVDRSALQIFATLFDELGTLWCEARLPVVHSREIGEILSRFASPHPTPKDLGNECFTTYMFDETASQRAGILEKKTKYPVSISGLTLQGPHFYVATPLNKTPNEVCETHRAYTSIDLVGISASYIPRTNLNHQLQGLQFEKQVPSWQGRPSTRFFRHISRRRCDPPNERTLISAIIPPGPSHTHLTVSLGMSSLTELVKFAGMTASVPLDFLVKTSGTGDVLASSLIRMPLPEFDLMAPTFLLRVLLLNCLTENYSELWNEVWTAEMAQDGFITSDRRCPQFFGRTAVWGPSTPLRTDLERRLAMLEIDVLSSLALGLSLDDLLTMYNVQFPVMRQYDGTRKHDQCGRLVPMSSTAGGSPAVNLVKLAATFKEQVGFDIHTEYHPDGSNTKELRKQKIRLGKKEADVLGVSERCTMADLLVETNVRWNDDDHPEGRPVCLVGLRYTDPGLEPRMERVYPTPWTRCDREADYRQAWAVFERRLGKKMPEGTPL